MKPPLNRHQVDRLTVGNPEFANTIKRFYFMGIKQGFMIRGTEHGTGEIRKIRPLPCDTFHADCIEYHANELLIQFVKRMNHSMKVPPVFSDEHMLWSYIRIATYRHFSTAECSRVSHQRAVGAFHRIESGRELELQNVAAPGEERDELTDEMLEAVREFVRLRKGDTNVETLRLHLFENKSYYEIAEDDNVAYNTVVKRMQRAMTQLHDRLVEAGLVK